MISEEKITTINNCKQIIINIISAKLKYRRYNSPKTSQDLTILLNVGGTSARVIKH